MINKYISKIAIVLIALVMWQCEPKVDSFTPSSGSADFSSFVAVGDSYTAGYTDGALGVRGQQSGFAYIVAKQLGSVGNKGFNQPMVKSSGSVGSTVINEAGQLNGYYELSTASGSLAPVPTMGDMAILAERVYDASNPFHNVGIPGAKATHLALSAPYPSYASLNPFYARFASATDATVIGDAMMAQPTFFSLWIGNNDVLAYALKGGDVDESNPNDPDLITDPAVYEQAMSGYLQLLTSAGAKGVVGNIPAIDAIPFFNTVPYNAFVIDANTAAALNANYATYNAAAEQLGLPKMEFVAGPNAFVIHDDLIPAQMGSRRQATADDKLLLTAQSEAMSWTPTSDPILSNEFVLTEAELGKIRTATSAYNSTINDLCSTNGLAKVDLSAIMDELSSKGLTIDGYTYTDTFVTGGVFSLDGIHATGRGSAIIANAFIEAINKQYGAMVPMANINDYAGVEFP